MISAESGGPKTEYPPAEKPLREWRWLTNIAVNDHAQQQEFYEAQGLEVRTSPARDKKGNLLPGMISLEVAPKEYGPVPKELEPLLEKIAAIDPRSKIGVEPFNDPDVQFYAGADVGLVAKALSVDRGDLKNFYRGTTLGFALAAAVKARGNIKSFDPDRADFKPMQTTVISDLRSVAEYYAASHGIDAATAEHDLRGIAAALNIDPIIIKERIRPCYYP